MFQKICKLMVTLFLANNLAGCSDDRSLGVWYALAHGNIFVIDASPDQGAVKLNCC